MMRILPIQFDHHTISRYCALFSACFPSDEKFTQAYMKWLYVANPEGNAVGFDAWDGEQLAAHYACIPAQARINGADTRIVLSLNTATHPVYQGKGIFTKLAEITYQTAAEQGFDGAYGIANANSTPGFIRKLGFQLVRPLEARIGLGCLQTDMKQLSGELSFERRWDSASIAWRCANPHNHIFFRQYGERWQFFAAAAGYGLPAYAELSVKKLKPAEFGRRHIISPMRLFLGLIPDRICRYWNYVSIPKRLRPSPLNLIYRPFASRVAVLDPRMVHFSFLDFDAY